MLRHLGLAVIAFGVPSPSLWAWQHASDPDRRKQLEQEIEMAMRQIEGGGLAIVEKLEPQETVREILLEILRKGRYLHPKSDRDRRFFVVAVHWLGTMREPRAIPMIEKVATDDSYGRGARVAAVDALAKIDPQRSKDVLVQVLYSAGEDRHLRVVAAEALAETRDRQALDAIETWARGETRPHYRQKLEAAAKKLRAKLQ